MHDVLVIHPVRPAAKWTADVLRSRGHFPAVAGNIDDASRLLAFVRFSTVVVWLPSTELEALMATLQSQGPCRPSAVILSWASATSLHAEAWFQREMDRVISLPMSSSTLLEAVERVDLRQAWHCRDRSVRRTSRQSAGASNHRAHLPTRTKSGRQPSPRNTMGT